MVMEKNKPAIDLNIPAEIDTATLAMGCFWSPDSLLGSLEGVLRTRVGYAGGSTANPTYRNLADHVETVQIDYDPSKISYPDLLHIFFHHHKPIGEPWKRQYMSAVFYHNKEQEQLAEQAKQKRAEQLGRKLYTAFYPLKEFYLAENRHQKYKLQRQPELMQEFEAMYPEFSDLINSTAAARVNAYVYGYGNRETLIHNMAGFGLSPVAQEVLLEKTASLKEVSPAYPVE